MQYTIIHPGGLVDTPAGVEEIVLDVDDKLGDTHEMTRIGREDVAALCVASLSVGNRQNASFDCITRKVQPGEKSPRTAEEALATFLEQSKSANYSLAA